MTSPCPTGACFYAGAWLLYFFCNYNKLMSSTIQIGDSRATEQPQLTVMHTIWMREHNRVAKKLSASILLGTTHLSSKKLGGSSLQRCSTSPSMNFYRLFWVSLFIFQFFLNSDWIEHLGPVTISQYGLAPLTNGFFTNYSSSLTSGPVSNEFATSAFRMGHSMVQGSVL